MSSSVVSSLFPLLILFLELIIIGKTVFQRALSPVDLEHHLDEVSDTEDSVKFAAKIRIGEQHVTSALCQESIEGLVHEKALVEDDHFWARWHGFVALVEPEKPGKGFFVVSLKTEHEWKGGKQETNRFWEHLIRVVHRCWLWRRHVANALMMDVFERRHLQTYKQLFRRL